MSTVPQRVFDLVDQHLGKLERSHEVAVPLAVARGSHAWGGAGPGSDYDVAFVFVPADLRRYAHLEEPTKTIVADRGEIEFEGVGVHRFAELLADSNEGAIDLLRSPIRYRTAFDPEPLRAYLEVTYDPMDLYHDWRSIAATNYRKYVSKHLVRDGEVYPLVADGDESGAGAESELEDGDAYVVHTDDGPRTVPADDERFSETKTRRTVKRTLTIYRAAMYARYLRTTGVRGDHDLPLCSFERFLDDQAPAVFESDRVECARDLLERKRAGEGDETIGDAVGREFAHPPREIDPDIHARSGPDPARLDEFVDELIAASGIDTN
ncbi:nucleotidyltransferase domain-containing protein [Halobiforma nitratireducens]|uniref:Nucleotidyltransferase, putative n=1 Tax=Halobiforma nitratireducens JCM 10879 TaxID=1227454 RepID=M0M772_9EURY|nr:nucleotidyltransferase domain-containing protein [Halobiforma nitratireducens]EMA41662.1 Nucleotidyltransferase, putative [Halobiforma nitratireducens JCM 10879]